MWLRLAAIALGLVSFGTAFIVYIILWIIMPATKTVADRLQLKGERVTLESIKQHAGDAIEFNGKTKPLVKLLRVLLGLGWVGLACLALMMLIAGTVAVGGLNSTGRISEIVSNWNNLSGWLFGSFGLLVVCGVLAVIFCSVAAYASFVWKWNKKIATTLIATAIAGIVLASASLGLGFYGKYEYDRQVEAHTHTKSLDVREAFSGAQTLTVSAKNVQVNYKVSSGAPRAELSYVSDTSKEPKVNIQRTAETVTITANEDVDNCDGPFFICGKSSTVTIYGPALSAIDVRDDSNISYATDVQPKLSVKSGVDAQVSLEEGVVEKLDVQVQRGSRFSAGNAAVADVSLRASDDTSFSFGSVNSLDFTAPNSCSDGGETDIYATHVNVLKRDTKTLDQSKTYDEKCLDLMIGDGFENEWHNDRKHEVFE